MQSLRVMGYIVRRMTLGIAAILCIIGAALAQQPTLRDPFLDLMIGKWVLTGTLGKTSTTQDVEAQWVLNHQFVQIREISRERAPDDATKPQYEALVLLGWDANKKQYVVYWTDVYGGGFSLRGYAQKTGSSLPIVFKSDDGNFYNTLTYDEKTETWHWDLDNETKGKRVPFARFLLRRLK